jgi:hypothetical protein
VQKDERVSELILAGTLLLVLFVSTVHWASSQSKDVCHARILDERIVRARLWASVVPFLAMVAVIVASTLALRTGDGSGLSRLVVALTSVPVIALLALCGMAGLYPAYLCARIWAVGAGSERQRLHLSLHVTVTYVALLQLLLAPGRVG